LARGRAVLERPANVREPVMASNATARVSADADADRYRHVGAAELFASALVGNKRADLIGEHTIGRVGIQRLIKLPTTAASGLHRALFEPGRDTSHEKGLEPPRC